jgi:hypothetical protein
LFKEKYSLWKKGEVEVPVNIMDIYGWGNGSIAALIHNFGT